MKRIFLALFLAMGAFLSLQALTLEVRTTEEFVAACNENPGADIILMNEINLTGQPTFDKTFTGSIISDPTSASALGLTNIEGPLFRKMEGAYLTGIYIRGGHATTTTEENLGLLALEAVSCTFDNIVVGDINVEVGNKAYGIESVGLLVGKTSGTSERPCVFNVIYFANCRIQAHSDKVGLAAGRASNTTFTGLISRFDCSVFADTPDNDAHAGGFCGYAENSHFSKCINIGMVGGDGDRVGGIVGYGKNTTLSFCTNSGTVIQCDESDFNDTYESVQERMKEQSKQNDDDITLYWASVATSIGSGALGVAILIGVNIISYSAGPLISMLVTGGIILGPLGAAVSVIAGVAALIVSIEYLFDQHDELGGICGTIDGGTIEGCVNGGACYSPDYAVGGILGLAQGKVVIDNCINTGEVHGDDHTGGIVGDLGSNTISNCLHTGTFYGDSPKGPLAGGFNDNSTWRNNYYWGAEYARPGIYYKDESSKIKNGICEVNNFQLYSGVVAMWLNEGGNTNFWNQSIGVSEWPCPVEDATPVIADSLKNTYKIENAAMLFNFANQFNRLEEGQNCLCAELVKDIDMSGTPNWIPIGTADRPFTGIFNGNGHTISNLHCTTDKAGAGLFGVVESGACIYDVHLDNTCSITSTNFSVGSIVGRIIPTNDYGFVVIDGCTSQAKLTGTYNVGGILGTVRWAQSHTRITISNCAFTGTITATGVNPNTSNGESAFICAACGENALIKNCYSQSTMTGGHFKPHMSFVHGTTFTIEDCYQYVSMDDNNPTSTDFIQTNVGGFTTFDAVQGILAYELNGHTNDTTKNLRWEHNIYNDQLLPRLVQQGEKCKGVYYTRDITRTIGTIVLPFDAASSNDITFYTLNDVSDPACLGFKSVTVLPAGTPAVFRASHTGTVTFLGCESDVFSYALHDVTKGAWTMKGYFGEPGSMDLFMSDAFDMSRLYYISGGKVKNATNSLSVDPLHAYLEGPSNTGAISIRLDGSDATLIEWAEMDEPADTPFNDDNTVYDLQGRRVDNPQNGIYIVGGKKVFIK